MDGACAPKLASLEMASGFGSDKLAIDRQATKAYNNPVGKGQILGDFCDSEGLQQASADTPTAQADSLLTDNLSIVAPAVHPHSAVQDSVAEPQASVPPTSHGIAGTGNTSSLLHTSARPSGPTQSPETPSNSWQGEEHEGVSDADPSSGAPDIVNPTNNANGNNNSILDAPLSAPTSEVAPPGHMEELRKVQSLTHVTAEADNASLFPTPLPQAAEPHQATGISPASPCHVRDTCHLSVPQHFGAAVPPEAAGVCTIVSVHDNPLVREVNHPALEGPIPGPCGANPHPDPVSTASSHVREGSSPRSHRHTTGGWVPAPSDRGAELRAARASADDVLEGSSTPRDESEELGGNSEDGGSEQDSEEVLNRATADSEESDSEEEEESERSTCGTEGMHKMSSAVAQDSAFAQSRTLGPSEQGAGPAASARHVDPGPTVHGDPPMTVGTVRQMALQLEARKPQEKGTPLGPRNVHAQGPKPHSKAIIEAHDVAGSKPLVQQEKRVGADGDLQSSGSGVPPPTPDHGSGDQHARATRALCRSSSSMNVDSAPVAPLDADGADVAAQKGPDGNACACDSHRPRLRFGNARVPTLRASIPEILPAGDEVRTFFSLFTTYLFIFLIFFQFIYAFTYY